MKGTKLLLPLALGAVLATGAFWTLRGPSEPAGLEFWHGTEQRVGHLGDAQPDFNLMGIASGSSLWVQVNGGEARELTVAEGAFGFRRLGGDGHFNADIPIAALSPGENRIELTAKGRGAAVSGFLSLTYDPDGSCPLPFTATWSELDHPQDAGQIVDGKWSLDEGGLRSEQLAYDRLFLLGNRSWRDYDVRTTLTIHEVAQETGPKSGAPGVGFILRFAGHTEDTPRFPDAQPKWGFQPFGAIVWLRWSGEGASAPPVRQFYRGDRNASQDGAALTGFAPGTTYAARASCTTSSDDPSTSTYRLKVWPAGSLEPTAWDLEVAQTSNAALRTGGVALVAHHASVTFGDVAAEPIGDGH